MRRAQPLLLSSVLGLCSNIINYPSIISVRGYSTEAFLIHPNVSWDLGVSDLRLITTNRAKFCDRIQAQSNERTNETIVKAHTLPFPKNIQQLLTAINKGRSANGGDDSGRRGDGGGGGKGLSLSSVIL